MHYPFIGEEGAIFAFRSYFDNERAKNVLGSRFSDVRGFDLHFEGLSRNRWEKVALDVIRVNSRSALSLRFQLDPRSLIHFQRLPLLRELVLQNSQLLLCGDTGVFGIGSGLPRCYVEQIGLSRHFLELLVDEPAANAGHYQSNEGYDDSSPSPHGHIPFRLFGIVVSDNPYEKWIGWAATAGGIWGLLRLCGDFVLRRGRGYKRLDGLYRRRWGRSLTDRECSVLALGCFVLAVWIAAQVSINVAQKCLDSDRAEVKPYIREGAGPRTLPPGCLQCVNRVSLSSYRQQVLWEEVASC